MRITRHKLGAKRVAKPQIVASGKITAAEGGAGGLTLSMALDGKAYSVHLLVIELEELRPHLERALSYAEPAPRAKLRYDEPRRPYRDD